MDRLAVLVGDHRKGRGDRIDGFQLKADFARKVLHAHCGVGRLCCHLSDSVQKGAALRGTAYRDDRSNEEGAEIMNQRGFLHARQDIKFLVFLLGAVVLMLGIIADRLTR
jgi:hypothetical protein